MEHRTENKENGTQGSTRRNIHHLIKEQNRLLKIVRRRIAEFGKWIKEKSAQEKNQSINPIHSVPIQPPTLLELLNTAMQQAGQPNSRYGKIRDLKTFAKAVSFLQSNNISTLSELQETLSGMKKGTGIPIVK